MEKVYSKRTFVQKYVNIDYRRGWWRIEHKTKTFSKVYTIYLFSMIF